MPNPDLASERRAFEAWYSTTGRDWTSGYLNIYGQYLHSEQEQCWQGWLARSAVPTVVSEEMVEAGAQKGWNAINGGDPWDNPGGGPSNVERNRTRIIVKAALTAALTVSSEVKDGQ